MAKIPAEAKELFEKVGSVAFSTADASGQPNTCIVGMKWIVDDETLYLSDQFFKKTYQNLHENQKVAVTFWEGHDAFQIHGTAKYVNEGPRFDECKAKVDAMFEKMGLPITAKGGVFLHVDSVYSSASGPNAGAQLA